jgi:alkylhydroperoxidase family enzyme
LTAFTAKVADGGLTATNAHVAALLAAGYSEDAVFECVVAVAVAAGSARLQIVERLLAAPS